VRVAGVSPPVASGAVPAHRPHRRRRAAALAGALALGLGAGLAACGADTPSRSQLADSLVRAGISRPVADCTAKAIVGTLSHAQLELIVERGPAAAPADDPQVKGDAAERLDAAMRPCLDQQQKADAATTTVPPSTTTSVLVVPPPVDPSTTATTAP
jgi:hypothetical protein